RAQERMLGLVYREALIDCGIPIVFATHGSLGIAPYDLASPSNHELVRGRYLSGLMLLKAIISYRDPVLVKQELKAEIVSIEVANLLPNAETLARLSKEQAVDPQSAQLPAILEIEV
ncbi:MAG: hypothetical protein ACT4P5_10330, partial [Armatimonadota bacterium]